MRIFLIFGFAGLLGSFAQAADTIAKDQWKKTIIEQFAPGYCARMRMTGGFKTADEPPPASGKAKPEMSVAEKEKTCVAAVTVYTRECLNKLEPQIPAQLDQAKSLEWGQKNGECIADLVRKDQQTAAPKK